MKDTLVYRGEVRQDRRVRSHDDRRVRVWRVLVRYAGPDGEEYRKSFETRDKDNDRPIIPMYGTSAELSKAKHQWKPSGSRAARDLQTYGKIL